MQEVRKICPHGVDIVLDPLNGDNSIKGYELLKPFGRICHYGAASITSESRSLVNAFKAWWKCLSINSLDIVSENKSVSGYHLGYLLNNPVVAKEMLNDINVLLDLYEKGQIKIKIDSTFSFSKIGEAMKRMHSRQNIGKIILKPDSEFEHLVSQDQVKIITTVITTTTSEKCVCDNATATEPTQIVPSESPTSSNEPVVVEQTTETKEENAKPEESKQTQQEENLQTEQTVA